MTGKSHPLTGYRVLDLSSGIPGGYCTKFLADAGADVVKVEAPGGDPLRRRAPEGYELAADEDGALFQFLAGSKRSVVIDPTSAGDVELLDHLVATAEGIVWSPGSPVADLPAMAPAQLRRRAPRATVTAITKWGLDGRWVNRPATEATLQAMSGGPMHRGDPSLAPMIMGGRVGDWVAGNVGAIGHLISRWRTLQTGLGELVDVSELESVILSMTMYSVTYASIAGRPFRLNRTFNLPAIHLAKDGYVGFMVVTGQQWLDFCVMVERPDWLEDESLILFDVRNARRAELIGHIDRWTAEKTIDEVIELANLWRIPVARVESGATAPLADHFRERNFYIRNPRSGFVQPDVSYTMVGSAERRFPLPAPRLGEHTEAVLAEVRSHGAAAPADAEPDDATPVPLPFAGLRVADFTANWAGPIVGHILALYGADVIHVESVQRPDNMRFNPIKPMGSDHWWDWSPLFHGPNANKRDLTLEMTTEKGQELARRLIAASDIVIENNSPRVFENWGLDWDAVRALNPTVIFVRAPAFGISGPWRDRTGYAQTMEMASGLAFMTGVPEAPPEIPNGPMDPIAGCHTTAALLLAMEHRRRTGEGMLLESPMIGGALNVAAEQVIEYSAHGVLLQREGNRSPDAAPQGAYLTSEILPTTGEVDRWAFISVETDEQWRALGRALGDPAWASDARFATHAGRREHHDEIDRHLAEWCATRTVAEIVEPLTAAGVPAAEVLLPNEPYRLDHLHDRGCFEELDHPITGRNVHMTFPAKLSRSPRVNRRHPPMLGQDNRDVLTTVLGLSDAEVDELEAQGVIGQVAGGVLKHW